MIHKKFLIIFLILTILLIKPVHAESKEIFSKINTLKQYMKIIEKNEFYNKYKILINNRSYIYERNLENIKENEKLYNNKKELLNLNKEKTTKQQIINKLTKTDYFLNNYKNSQIKISNFKIYPYFEVTPIPEEKKYIKKETILKSGAHENYNNLIVLNLNDEINVIGIIDNAWYKVQFKEYLGYILITDTSDKKVDIKPNKYNISGNCKNIELMNNFISKIPEKILNFLETYGWQIKLTTENIAKTEFQGIYKSVMGVTIKDTKTVKIEDRPKAIKESLIHEIGHAIDFTNTNNELYKYSTSKEFLEIYKKESQNSLNLNGATLHTSSSSSEYFAECINQYVLNPENMLKHCPLSYNYVDDLINNF